MSPEQQIAKVLAGLRDAEPPADMERRILNVLEHRATQTRSPIWRWRYGPWRELSTANGSLSVWLGGITAGLLLGLAILANTLMRHVAPKPVSSNPVSEFAVQPTIKDQNTPASPSREPLPIAARRSEKGSGRPSKGVPPERSLAEQETEAPSLPAPPMPLTAQERALLRIGRRRQPEVVAILNADLRAQEQARARTEFYNFFEPATAKKTNE